MKFENIRLESHSKKMNAEDEEVQMYANTFFVRRTRGSRKIV